MENDNGTIRAVLFDLDGTLVNTPKGIVVAFKAALKDLGNPNVNETDIRATIGMSLPKAFERLLGEDARNSSVEERIDLYQTYFRKLVLPRADRLVFPGVREGLRRLAFLDVRLAVVTNKFHSTAEQLLRAAGLRDHFQLVIGADQVAQPKPHPEMGYLALSKLDLTPAQVVMVGDTVHDLEMASSVGIRSIAVTYGIHNATQLNIAAPTWVEHRFDDVIRRASSLTGSTGVA